MKTRKFMLLGVLACCAPFLLAGCGNSEFPADSVVIMNSISNTHYLKFIENGSEVMRLVVLEGETYEDLQPYFPTLTEEPGYVKWWDGDYRYTSYTKDNQFKVWDEKDLVIDINAYSRKA